MLGKIEHELELQVPASEAWDMFGTIELAKFASKELPELFEKVEVIEGDGGVGTVLKLTFVPGTSGPSVYIEKFTKIDNENRIKETDIIEGGYFELGFTLFKFRFQVIEKSQEPSIIKSTIEFELKEENAANVSLLPTQPLVHMVEAAHNYLNKNKAAKQASQ
ncbi:S-norcoclaurine synthase 2, partial [Mucuna pruriens]